MPHVTIPHRRATRVFALLEQGVSIGDIAKRTGEHISVIERIDRQRSLDRLLVVTPRSAWEPDNDPDVQRYRLEKARRPGILITRRTTLSTQD